MQCDAEGVLMLEEECINDVEDPCKRALRDVMRGERFLVRRGSRSSFYRVNWEEKGAWLGLKEERCVEPVATVRAILAMQRLNSEFILRHYGVFIEADQVVVILSELMDYALSDVVLRRHRHLTERQIRAVAFLTLNALSDLHDKLQMVHADVNPSNIFLRVSGELKLGDLSSAIVANAAVEYYSGTFLYTAIEVLKDRQLASRPSSDIWALGVTLYQCASGDHPFVGKCNSNFWAFLSSMEAAMQIRKSPKPLTHTGDDFHELLNAMLQWDPALRPTARSLLGYAFFSQFSRVAAQEELRLLAA